MANQEEPLWPDLQVHTVPFVDVTNIVPEAWQAPLLTTLHEKKRYVWGDSPHTLVTAEGFAETCEAVLGQWPEDHPAFAGIDRPKEAVKEFIQRLWRLALLIDLEAWDPYCEESESCPSIARRPFKPMR